MPRGRVLSLLALLLVHRGTTVHCDRIVDELGAAAPAEKRQERGAGGGLQAAERSW